jgi:hypothetical protein
MRKVVKWHQERPGRWEKWPDGIKNVPHPEVLA